jgi:hypothetical protein
MSADTKYTLKMFTVCVLLPCVAMMAVAAIASAGIVGAPTYQPTRSPQPTPEVVAPVAVSPGHVIQPVFATQARAVEVCFPARFWNARAEDRPCDMIGRPAEDGSGYLYLGTLGADAAVCSIPNPYEERGRFSVKCHRLPNR